MAWSHRAGGFGGNCLPTVVFISFLSTTCIVIIIIIVTDLQYKTLESLLYILKEKYSIYPDRILGHSDISPLRKIDPGEKFDWKRLAKKKLAVWPHKIMIPKNKTRDIYYYLSSIGYDVETDLNSGLLAFKRHFIPTDNSLVIDQKVLNIAYSVSEEFIKIRSLY